MPPRYAIQRLPEERFPFFNLPRVDYEQVIKSLRLPVVWVHDELLDAWLPVEVTPEQLKPPVVALPKRRLPLSELQARYQRDGFVVVPQLLSSKRARQWADRYEREAHHDRWPDMEGIKRTSLNNMPVVRLLHQATEGLVRAITGENIKTSYSFTARYEAGSTLPAHTDRPQCELNITLLFGGEPSSAPLSSWPLYIARGEVVHEAKLEAGDAVIYSGTRDLHWRDMMPAELQSVTGTFLHYVPESFAGSLD